MGSGARWLQATTIGVLAALALFAAACGGGDGGASPDVVEDVGIAPDASSGPDDSSGPDTADAEEAGDATDALDAPDALDTPDADGGPGPLPAALADELEALLADAPDLAGAPGVLLSVHVPGHAPWLGAAGLAAVDPERPVAVGDRFRIGSITKTFTAAAVLRLIEDGVISLDDPVDDRVPGFALGPAVTVETLLNHTSGIFNYTDDPHFLELGRQAASPEEVIAFALEHPSTSEPGAAYSYTNTGYFLLGLIVEEATGRPLSEHVRETLLAPRGLDDTFLDGAEPVSGGMVDGHVNGVDMTDAMDMSWAWAAGGMVSDADDLCRWGRDLLLGDVLSEPMRAAMLAPTTLPGGGTVSYGYGVRHLQRGGRTVAGHTGSTMGFTADLFVHLDSGACVAALANDFLAEPEAVADRAWEAVFAWQDGR